MYDKKEEEGDRNVTKQSVEEERKYLATLEFNIKPNI